MILSDNCEFNYPFKMDEALCMSTLRGHTRGVRYNTDIAALNIGRYRYGSDAISARIIHTFITHFVGAEC